MAKISNAKQTASIIVIYLVFDVKKVRGVPWINKAITVSENEAESAYFKL